MDDKIAGSMNDRSLVLINSATGKSEVYQNQKVLLHLKDVQKFWLCEWIDGWTTVYHNMSCL
jgi:hypothetical protein